MKTLLLLLALVRPSVAGIVVTKVGPSCSGVTNGYVYTAQSNKCVWAVGGGGGSGVDTVGTFSGSAQTNGASIASTTITFGPASATVPGMISTGSQTMAGAKTFSTSVTSPSYLFTGNANPTVTTSGASGALTYGGGDVVKWAASEFGMASGTWLLPYGDNNSDNGGTSNRWRNFYVGTKIFVNSLEFFNDSGNAVINQATSNKDLEFWQDSTWRGKFRASDGYLSLRHGLAASTVKTDNLQASTTFGLISSSSTSPVAYWDTGYFQFANAVNVFGNGTNNNYLGRIGAAGGIYPFHTGYFSTALVLGADTGDSITDPSAAGTIKVKTGTNLSLDADNVALTGGFLAPALATSSAATTGTMCWTTGTGNVNVDTTTTCLLSAGKYKQDVEPLDVGLKQVMSLRPVSYQLKKEFNPSGLGRQVGFIAEEVQKVDGRLVSNESDGSAHGVRYLQLTAVLVKAIQQQQLEIVAMQAAIAELQKKVK